MNKEELSQLIDALEDNFVATLNIDSEPVSLFIADDGFLMSEVEETLTLKLRWKKTVKR